MVIDATDENFSKITSEGESLVMFHMVHCPGCETLLPSLMRIETQLPFTKLVRVDIDECPITAEKFHVHATPAIYFCKAGQMEKYEGEHGIKQIRNAFGRRIYELG